MSRSVTIVGSGNWGSTIAKIVGNNVKKFPEFEDKVRMWVFDEIVEGQKLSDMINREHENKKYLPGIQIPSNVVAVPNLMEATSGADVLIFVLPHQFIGKVLMDMKDHIKPDAYGVSLIKGLDAVQTRGIRLITDIIRDELNISCAVLMGANLAPEVAKENFCEATIGCKDCVKGTEIKKLFQTDYFRLVLTPDEVGVELCGALKNVIALGAGFAEGLGYGENTKAAIIRLGLMEMMRFSEAYFGERGAYKDTFLESCGIADLVTTCYGGRNRRVALALVKTGKPIPEIEKELLNGQSAQGPLTAREVNRMLVSRGDTENYPLFTAVHEICCARKKPSDFVDCLRNHPVHK